MILIIHVLFNIANFFADSIRTMAELFSFYNSQISFSIMLPIGNRWWLDGFAYMGLMALAYVRIAMYRLKAAASR